MDVLSFSATRVLFVPFRDRPRHLLAQKKKRPVGGWNPPTSLGVTMAKYCNPRPKVSKQPSPDNFDTGILIHQLYEDLVEVEALAVTADEAVTELPPRPRGKYGRTLARLYTLVGKTSGRAQGALERGEELVAMRAAQLVARVPNRSPARRAR
jgi:hypothetical protein